MKHAHARTGEEGHSSAHLDVKHNLCVIFITCKDFFLRICFTAALFIQHTYFKNWSRLQLTTTCVLAKFMWSNPQVFSLQLKADTLNNTNR